MDVLCIIRQCCACVVYLKFSLQYVTWSDNHSTGSVCNGKSSVISHNANLFYIAERVEISSFFKLFVQKKLAFVCCSLRKTTTTTCLLVKLLAFVINSPCYWKYVRRVLSEFLLSPHSPHCPHASLNSCVLALEGRFMCVCNILMWSYAALISRI